MVILSMEKSVMGMGMGMGLIMFTVMVMVMVTIMVIVKGAKGKEGLEYGACGDGGERERAHATKTFFAKALNLCLYGLVCASRAALQKMHDDDEARASSHEAEVGVHTRVSGTMILYDHLCTHTCDLELRPYSCVNASLRVLASDNPTARSFCEFVLASHGVCKGTVDSEMCDIKQQVSLDGVDILPC